MPDGSTAITDVGWAEPVKAHQNPLAASPDAHGPELWRGLPTTSPTGPQVSARDASGGAGSPAPNRANAYLVPNADSVRHSLTC